jgi:hypothetical protein
LTKALEANSWKQVDSGTISLAHEGKCHHQGRQFIAIGALENGAFCTVFSEIFHKF